MDKLSGTDRPFTRPEDSRAPRPQDPRPVRPRESRTPADDRVNKDEWTKPVWGTIPHIRIGKSWFNVMWVLPLGFAALLVAIAASQSMRQYPFMQDFIAQYPGQPKNAPKIEAGFPGWLRWQHFFNMFFMMFMIRAGIQILADHPRLYWNRDSTPGTEWFRFSHPVAKERIEAANNETLAHPVRRQDQIWTAKDDSVTLPGWLGLPGLRHSIGLARWWHFTFDLLWLVNGIVFYVLLFSTHQWQRLVPVDWSVFPNALSTAIQYASLRFPTEDTWTRFNGLQQLTYFITVFVAAPVSVATGLLQAPAISNKFEKIGKIFNRQVARSIHFISMGWFVFFIVAHGTMVLATSVRDNTNHMWAGVHDDSWSGFPWFVAGMTVIALAWAAASPFTLHYARVVQRVGRFAVGWIKGAMEWYDPKAQFKEEDISPYLWPNGQMPDSKEYEALIDGRFEDWRLRVFGLVEHPMEFSLADLKAMHKQEQITKHFCIQGWSGVAKWGGVPMTHIMDLVRPKAEARFAVFYSLADGEVGCRYYDAHEMRNMHHELTILAYEMNGAPLAKVHGAPLRLRCENELGFKMVKWISEIEFVHDFAHIGDGQGGYHEDHEFYGYKMPI